jgi:hypothetical protein
MSNDISVTMSVTLRNDGSTITLRQIALGLEPMVLIEPKITDGDNLHLEIDATSFDSREDLAALLEVATEVLRSGSEADRA